MSMPVQDTNGRPVHRDWTVRSVTGLGMLTLVYAFNYLDRSILSIVLPLIKQDLELSDTALGLISGLAFVLFYSLMGVPIARLADRYSRRNIIGIGLAFWSLMTALTGAVTSVWQLATARFLMGAGEAAGIAPSNAMVADMFSAKRRSLVLSVLSSGNGIGAIFLFPVVGYIAHAWGWRMAFYSAGIAGIVLAALFFLLVREPPRGGVEADRSAPPPKPMALLEVARLLWKSSTFVYIVSGGMLMGVAMYAAMIWHPSFLIRVHGLDIAQAATILGPLRGIGSVVGVILGGVLADFLARGGQHRRLWVPAIACAGFFPAELVFLFSDHLTVSIIGMAVATMFGAMQLGPLYAAMMSSVPVQMRATTAAVFLLCVNLVGQTIGPLVIGMLNDYLGATLGDHAIRWSLVVGTFTAVLAGLGFYMASRHSQRNASFVPTP